MKNLIIKRGLVVVLCFSFLLLGGCTPFSGDFDLLMNPPALSGEMEPIGKALNQGISGKYTLKFPASGDNKNAINMIDLDSDGQQEAVAIYSTTRDGAVSMNVCVVDNINGKWQVAGSQSILGAGVEKVIFKDLNGDGKNEILIGWNVFGSAQKTLCVYSYAFGGVNCMLSESYTEFITCDLDDDFTNDLLIINLDTTQQTANASYFNIDENGITEIGNCELDPNVTGYFPPVLTKLTSGKFCVYLESYKGAGVTTEIIYFADGVLKNPLYNKETNKSITDRTTVITSRDFDGDSNLEVPIMTALPVEERFSVNELAYLTTWCRFDGNEFVPTLYTLLNYTDGYYFNLSQEQTKQITVVRNVQNRERIIYEYDYKHNRFGEEIFSIRTVSKAAYDAGTYNGDNYQKLGENSDIVYLIKMAKTNFSGFTKEDIQKSFNVIREE